MIKHFFEKDFSFYRIQTLIIWWALTLFALVPFVRHYLPDPKIHLGIILVINALFTVFWYYKRTVFPKGTGNKNIVIAITTEDNNQKVRIKDDFATKMLQLLKDYDLNKEFEVVVLHTHLSRDLSKIIEAKKENDKSKGLNPKAESRFLRVKERLNAKFIVYGTLKKRNVYNLKVEAIILHNPVNKVTSDTFSREFNSAWVREVNIIDQDELNEFEESAKHVFFVATYMLSLATLVDNQFDVGIKILRALEHYIKQNKELENYRSRIESLRLVFLELQADLLFLNRNIKESLIVREEYLEIINDPYAKLLTKSIQEIINNKDGETALSQINAAMKKAPNGDITWLYNKFYVLIFLERMKDALKAFDQILQTTANNEKLVIRQVISFNQMMLQNDISHIQSYFIIGALVYKKLNKPIMAYEEIQKFVIESEGKSKWNLFNIRARQYIREIDKIMGSK